MLFYHPEAYPPKNKEDYASASQSARPAITAGLITGFCAPAFLENLHLINQAYMIENHPGMIFPAILSTLLAAANVKFITELEELGTRSIEDKKIRPKTAFAAAMTGITLGTLLWLAEPVTEQLNAIVQENIVTLDIASN